MQPQDHPLYVINAAKEYGIKEIIVAYSSGKDSLAVLDLCVKHFERVVPYFMYIVKGLEFQEVHLKYVERLYSLEIIRVPDWRLCQVIRSGVARHQTRLSQSVPSVSWKDVEHYIRQKSGIHWIASGETAFESMQRRGMIMSSDRGIDIPRGHIYPVGFWRRSRIESYLTQAGLTLPCEYRVMSKGRSFGGVLPDQIYDIRKNYPRDFEKIKELFPLVESQAIRFEVEQDERKRAKANAVSDRKVSPDSSELDQERSLQSAEHLQDE